MENSAIYAGSFDPIHNGHLFVIETAVSLFDNVYVVVAHNSDKKDKEFIPHEARLKLIKRIMKSRFPNVKVISLKDTFIADFALQHGIKFLIRGLRNSDDFDIEKTMSRINMELGDNLQTVFAMAPVDLDMYSSSLIKGFVNLLNWEDKIKGMVPEEIYDHILFNNHGGKYEFMNAVHFCLKGENLLEFSDNDLNRNLEKLFEEIHKSYADKKTRHYHDLSHVRFMTHEVDIINTSLLLEKDGITLSLRDKMLLKIASWIHDVKIVPGATNNEKLSKEFGDLFLKALGMKDPDIKDIGSMVQATDHKGEDDDSYLNQIICDLDFALGGKSNIEEWLTTTNKIRKEYSKFDDKEWRSGRIKFLKGLVSKTPSVFRTKYFHDLYGENIKRNAKIELDNLLEYVEDSDTKKESFD